MFVKSSWMYVCLLVIIVAAPGFGQDEKKGAAQEKKGEKDLVKKIIGQWVANGAATKKYWDDNKIDGPDRILEDASKMTISFMKDNKLQVIRKRTDGDDFKVEGTFEYVKGDLKANALTVKFVPSTTEGPREIEVELKIIDIEMKPGLVITPDNDPPVVFMKGNKPEGNKPASKPEKKK